MQRDPGFVVKDATRKPLDTHEWCEGHCPSVDEAMTVVS
jgi:hypothetical protein